MLHATKDRFSQTQFKKNHSNTLSIKIQYISQAFRVLDRPPVFVHMLQRQNSFVYTHIYHTCQIVAGRGDFASPSLLVRRQQITKQSPVAGAGTAPYDLNGSLPPLRSISELSQLSYVFCCGKTSFAMSFWIFMSS